MARLRQAQGDVVAAVGLLEEAERVYVGDFSPNVQPIAATRARVLAAAGEVAEALAWARRRGLAATDELSYLREYEHLTLARVLYADHAASGRTTSLAEAAGLLDRLLPPAEAGGRLGVVIEMLVLQALVRAAAGEQEPALESLERAARLAEPEGYVRVFTGEAAPMLDLLKALGRRNRQWGFVTPAARSHDLPCTDGRRPGRLATQPNRRESSRGSRSRQPRPAWAHRPVERSRARRAAVSRLRPRRPGHRPRARGVAEHRAHPHPAHLHQARRHQPPRRRPAGPPTEPPPHPRPGPEPHARQWGRASSTGRDEARKFISPLITGDDVRSSPPLLACQHQHGAPQNRPTAWHAKREEQP